LSAKGLQTAAMPSSSSRRQKPPTLAPAPGEARDWAALPQDILLAVFLKLGPLEIMQGAELVCTAWRRVAVDEPILWRRVDMGTVTTWSAAGRAMARAAVDRGEGQCEAFSGPCDSDLLLCLIERYQSFPFFFAAPRFTSNNCTFRITELKKFSF